MKFSIIIPVYKVEAYLEQCIESVLQQTLQDYEVILVDDGSPDGCPAICDKYAAEDSRFHVIHKENGGLSSARNAGLDAAQGKYIYFLDSDDAAAPELLETAARYMDSGLDLLIFRYHCLRQDGTREEGRKISLGRFCLDTEKERLKFLRDELVPCKLGWEAWSRVYVRENIEKYGLRFEDNRKIFAEDLYFCMCYCGHSCRIESIEDCLYYYRIREDSIMGVQQTRSNLGRICKLGEAVLRFYRRFDDCALLAEEYDEIYYQLIGGQFLYQMWSSGISPEDFRELARQEVTDWSSMEQFLRTFLRKHPFRWNRNAAELRANVLFLLGGSALALRIRCRILRAFSGEKEKK